MKEKEPLVTVVTVTYNLLRNRRGRYFGECLESVQRQTYRNIEHLIIDGASDDGTLEVIKGYADKGWVKYISEPDTGIYSAMNKGIRKAKGKYISFLNSDDYYHNPRAVELSVEALEQGADYSYADHLVTGRGQKYVDRAIFDRFVCTMPFGHPTMFTKKSVMVKEGGFDESLGLPADYDLAIRLILKGYKPIYVDDVIASYRLGGASVTTDYMDDIAKIYRKNYSKFFDLTTEEARKIFLEKVLPDGFLKALGDYAQKNKLPYVDTEKTAKAVETAAAIKRWGVRDIIKDKLSHYPITSRFVKKSGE